MFNPFLDVSIRLSLTVVLLEWTDSKGKDPRASEHTSIDGSAMAVPLR
jgi:hypothetical protein